MNKKIWLILILVFVATLLISLISWLIFEYFIWILIKTLLVNKEILFISVLSHYSSVMVMMIMIMIFSPFGYKVYLKYK